MHMGKEALISSKHETVLQQHPACQEYGPEYAV